MRKDKAWLKDEVKSLFDKAYDLGKMEYHESEESTHRINSLIDQLEEPEILSQEWINEHSKAYTMENSVEISDLKNLLLPQPKKPVIPQHVADWIDTHNLYGNNPLREYRDLEKDFNEGWTNEEGASVYHWINKNPYVFIDALRCGCEVEKEQLYTVCFEDYNNVYQTGIFLYKDGEVVNSGNAMQNYDKEDNESHLTEKEIKDYDDRFWRFAEEVTE